MYEFQYLISGALSLFVCIYIIYKRPRTWALKSLSLFGLVVTLWEVSVFLNMTAPHEISAANFWLLTMLTSHLCLPLYLFTILNIRERGNAKFLLVFIPAIIQIFIIFQKDYITSFEFFPTEFGWFYRVASYQIPLIIVGIIFVGYLAGIFVVLLRLTMKTRVPLLKIKYTVLLVSFTLFQAVGTTLINALISLSLVPPSFRVGGILQFVTFLLIWYALSLKKEKVRLPFIRSKGFSEVYSSFLTIFYNSTIDSQLGEEFFKFKEFVTQSKIDDQISLSNDKIIYKEKEDLDIAELINRNLKIFDTENPVYDKAVYHYLRVLNEADGKLGWRFEQIVNANENFLKKSDLIYGISGGKFLEKIVEDKSLDELDDIDACLRIYKRLLLSIMDIVQTKTEFREKLSKFHVTKALEITDFGEISLNGVKDQILKTPKGQRLSLIIDSFNALLSQVYEDLLADPDVDMTEILRKLKLVLTLNKDKAIDFGVYPTLLGTLATKIPRTQTHKLYSDYLEELVQERTKELKETQEKLLKTQRLATIGEAAAMVGHDLRNPLQAIELSRYLMQKKLKKSPHYKDLQETLEIIKNQVKYMSKIVFDLQDYARPLKLKLVKTSLHELINETQSTVTIPETVKVSILIEEDLNFGKLMIDPLLIRRVFINLITNALQAMPNGGQLIIRASKTEEATQISFQDTGVGITEENIPKLFQPLFTTKAKGQGLGLAVCKRLIEAHNGKIMVKSKMGIGSTFTIVIPTKPANVLNKQESSTVLISR